ncbi:MAG: AAA family ATPase [Patescibacteria group bacterium]
MNLFVEKIKISQFGGIFDQEVSFTNGLNIISGENGTGKTRLLTAIKVDSVLAANSQGLINGNQTKILAFSPKRNSQRKTVENALTEFRQQNKRIESLINDYMGKQMQDTNFENYPPFGELFAGYFEQLDRAGGNRRKTVKKVEKEFNLILTKLFSNYLLTTNWDPIQGTPSVILRKSGTDITLNDLSLGEQEILSLIFNLYVSRNETDILLIDEPEVHLNWSLELVLFEFLDNFCKKYHKQIIVVTHSRVIFNKKFYPKTQFLVWESGKIICKKEIDDVAKGKLAGEAVSLTQIVKIIKKTFFVEDSAHKKVINKIAEVLTKDVEIIECDNKSNVKSLLKMVGSKSDYSLARFVIDSDNEGNPFPTESKLVFLKKYCMECYLADIATLVIVLSDTEINIKAKIHQIITTHKAEILKTYKHLSFLIDRLQPTDITNDLLADFDCSIIIIELLKVYNLEFDDFIDKYVKHVNADRKLSIIFESKLIQEIKT